MSSETAKLFKKYMKTSFDSLQVHKPDVTMLLCFYALCLLLSYIFIGICDCVCRVCYAGGLLDVVRHR